MADFKISHSSSKIFENEILGFNFQKMNLTPTDKKAVAALVDKLKATRKKL